MALETSAKRSFISRNLKIVYLPYVSNHSRLDCLFISVMKSSSPGKPFLQGLSSCMSHFAHDFFRKILAIRKHTGM